MLYGFRLVGAHALRFLVQTAGHLLTPKQPTPPPKPFRTIHVPRRSSIGKANGKVRCDVYLPKRLTDAASLKASASSEDGSQTQPIKTLPVVVNLHGSGFMMKSMGDDARFCQRIADLVPCAVIDADYCKAPEAPYPAANLDIDAVLAWLQSKGEGTPGVIAPQEALKTPDADLDVKTDRVALTGFSSGGNLALTASVRAHQRGELDRIAAVVAFYPSTNLSESPWEKPKVKPEKGASGGVLPPFMRNFLYTCYVNEAKHTAGDPSLPPRSSPLISPLYAEASDFPHSVTLITCSGDSLEREGRQMAEHIVAGRSSGLASQTDDDGERAEPPCNVPDVERVPIKPGFEQAGVLWWQAQGQGHAWDKMTAPGSEPEALRDESYQIVIGRLRQALMERH